MRSAACLLLLSLCSLLACERWVPLASAQVPESALAPHARFDRMLIAAQQAGYRVVEVESRRGRFRVIGFSEDGNFDDPHGAVTYFTVQVYTDGSASVTPSGFLVKPTEGVMHRRVGHELDRFMSFVWDA